MRLRRHRRWPHGPRFTVGSVTGSLIQQTTRGGGHTNRPMPVLWYVHDAAYCYRIVHEGWDEQTARRLARRLNREETLTLADEEMLDASAGFLPMPDGEKWEASR